MSESAAWIHRDEGGHAMKRILDAAPASRKSYILDLRDELKTFVSLDNLSSYRSFVAYVGTQYDKTRCRWLWLYSLRDVKANLLSFV